MTRVYVENEEALKKDLDHLKNQNKRLKVELEQTKVVNAKLKEDIE